MRKELPGGLTGNSGLQKTAWIRLARWRRQIFPSINQPTFVILRAAHRLGRPSQYQLGSCDSYCTELQCVGLRRNHQLGRRKCAQPGYGCGRPYDIHGRRNAHIPRLWSVQRDDDSHSRQLRYRGVVRRRHSSGRSIVAASVGPLTATVGVPLSGQFGSFTDGDPNPNLADLTAGLFFGDENCRPPCYTIGTITKAPNGSYLVSSSHTYLAPGTYNYTVAIFDKGAGLGYPTRRLPLPVQPSPCSLRRISR